MASASSSRQVEGAVVLDKRDACRETNIAYTGIRLNDGVLVVRFAGINVPLQFLILVATSAAMRYSLCLDCRLAFFVPHDCIGQGAVIFAILQIIPH
jgi:hypothetical protein